MNEAQGGGAIPPARRPRGNFELRVISGLILAAIVLGITWFGGLPFRLMAAAIGAAIFYEWACMAGRGGSAANRNLAIALLAVSLGAVAAGLPALWAIGITLLAVIAGMAGGAMLGQGSTLAVGVGYASLPMLALALLRGDGAAGMVAILFLFAVVWATDIFAYFAGRRFGGPKLAPRVSPSKTWSGAAGGALAAAAAGWAVLYFADVRLGPGTEALLSLALSAVAQLGDLFESGVKRRFDIKDSGRMIPGHGGMMDRVDGLVAAALALYLISAIFGGSLDYPAESLFAL